MVHLVSQRPKLYHVLWEALARRAYSEGLPVINPTQGHLVELGFELCYIFAMVTFVLGSVLFFPSYSRDAFSWGCHLYIVGSLLTAVLSMYDLAESVLWRRVCISNEADHEIVEKFLYVVGSVLFAVGTALFEHPIEKEGSTQLAETVAVTMFFVGSTFFALAAYVNALSLYRRHPCLIRWALVICTCYVLGGVLFCSGTVAFMPGVPCEECVGDFFSREECVRSHDQESGATKTCSPWAFTFSLRAHSCTSLAQSLISSSDGPSPASWVRMRWLPWACRRSVHWHSSNRPPGAQQPGNLKRGGLLF